MFTQVTTDLTDLTDLTDTHTVTHQNLQTLIVLLSPTNSDTK